jgi:nitroreductase
MIMDLGSAIVTRRSIRNFKDKPIEEDLIKEIMDLSLWAPSGRNRQPWHFVVVRGKKLTEIKNLIKSSFPLVRPTLEELYDVNSEIIKTTEMFFNNLGNAPCVILVYIPFFKININEEMSLNQRWDQDRSRVGCICAGAMAGYNISLFAHERGLGTCWMTGPLVYREEISHLIGIKDKELICVMPIGYPERTPDKGPKRKKNVIEWVE